MRQVSQFQSQWYLQSKLDIEKKTNILSNVKNIQKS